MVCGADLTTIGVFAMQTEKLEALAGTTWTGTGELWLDPLGNEASTGPCTMTFERGVVRYTWQHGDTEHSGRYDLAGATVRWSDTFHQPTAVACKVVAGAWGIFALHYTYAAGGPDWGWRTILAERPDGTLVLQMVNVTPWGEEARAVRMVFRRAS